MSWPLAPLSPAVRLRARGGAVHGAAVPGSAGPLLTTGTHFAAPAGHVAGAAVILPAAPRGLPVLADALREHGYGHDVASAVAIARQYYQTIPAVPHATGTGPVRDVWAVHRPYIPASIRAAAGGRLGVPWLGTVSPWLGTGESGDGEWALAASRMLAGLEPRATTQWTTIMASAVVAAEVETPPELRTASGSAHLERTFLIRNTADPRTREGIPTHGLVVNRGPVCFFHPLDLHTRRLRGSSDAWSEVGIIALAFIGATLTVGAGAVLGGVALAAAIATGASAGAAAYAAAWLDALRVELTAQVDSGMMTAEQAEGYEERARLMERTIANEDRRIRDLSDDEES